MDCAGGVAELLRSTHCLSHPVSAGIYTTAGLHLVTSIPRLTRGTPCQEAGATHGRDTCPKVY